MVEEWYEDGVVWGLVVVVELYGEIELVVVSFKGGYVVVGEVEGGGVGGVKFDVGVGYGVVELGYVYGYGV